MHIHTWSCSRLLSLVCIVLHMPASSGMQLQGCVATYRVGRCLHAYLLRLLLLLLLLLLRLLLLLLLLLLMPCV